MAKRKRDAESVHEQELSNRTSREEPAERKSRSTPRIEESLTISKKGVEESKFYIRKTVVEEDVSEQVQLFHDHVQTVRVPVNQYVDSMPEVRHEANTMIIPVVKELLVVEKKLMLIEEIRVIRTKQKEIVPVRETLRKEEVEITDRIDRTSADE